MKYLVLGLLVSLTGCMQVPTEEEVSETESRRGDVDGTRNVVNIGVYVNDRNTMKKGELKPDEVAKDVQYSGDKWIDRRMGVYSAKAAKDNENVTGLYFKMQALKPDHVEERPARITLKNGYWVSQKCKKTAQIWTLDLASDNGGSMQSFCVLDPSSKDYGETPIYQGQITLKDGAKSTEKVEIEVHWKRKKLANKNVADREFMVTSMTVGLSMSEGGKIADSDNKFFPRIMKAKPRVAEKPPEPTQTEEAQFKKYENIKLEGTDLGWDGWGECSISFEMRKLDVDKSFSYREEIGNTTTVKQSVTQYSEVALRNIEISEGCQIRMGLTAIKFLSESIDIKTGKIKKGVGTEPDAFGIDSVATSYVLKLDGQSSDMEPYTVLERLLAPDAMRTHDQWDYFLRALTSVLRFTDNGDGTPFEPYSLLGSYTYTYSTEDTKDIDLGIILGADNDGNIAVGLVAFNRDNGKPEGAWTNPMTLKRNAEEPDDDLMNER